MRRMALLVLAALAAAENDPKKEIERLSREGKGPEAARLAGTWVANAQKRNDVIEEQAAWEALRDVRLDDAQYRDACAEVMKLLDPKRNGAYLSAHLLALEVVRAAVREGDDRHLADALALLKVPRKDAGACAATLAEFATGVLEARQRMDSKPKLESAFDAAIRNGWLDLATHAGIELACADGERSKEIVERLNVALRKGKDTELLFEAMRIAAKRLPGAKFDEPGDGAPGGAGGAGGAGGRGGEAPVADALKTFSASKPLVKVKRTVKGFDIEPQFDGASKGSRDQRWGIHHWNGGGLTLALCGAGVSLKMIDPTGRDGQPGDGGVDEWSVFYLLAPGETWSVTKEGVVSVKK